MLGVVSVFCVVMGNKTTMTWEMERGNAKKKRQVLSCSTSIARVGLEAGCCEIWHSSLDVFVILS
jgi:hypothetical protein